MNLPNGWKEVKLGECFDIQLGKMLNESARKQEPQFPYIANVNVRWGALDLSTLSSMFFSEREKEKFALKKNDILMCEGGEIGRCVVLKEDVQDVYYQKACHRLRTKNNLCDPWYLYFYMSYIVKSAKIIGLVGESSIAHLPVEKVEKILLTLPPLAEQKKIAETLSVWDSAIEKMEKLIEQKEKSLEVHLYKCYKNLLNGKKVSLGSLFDKEIFVEKGVNILKAEATDDGSVPVVGAGQTYTCYHHKCTHSFPTITISSSGAYAGYVWFHSIPIWASDCSVLYTKTMDIRYLFYFLKSKQQDIYKLQVGGAQPHVYAKDLKKMLIPDVDETIQKSVVIVFQQIELELSLLKQQLALYKKQKQGLMQKLLTGEWRVK